MRTSRSRYGLSVWHHNAWCAVVFAFVLHQPAGLKAQLPQKDPADVFLDALDRDLDNLPSQTDASRKAIRDAILDHRAKVLGELEKKLTTAVDLSRALRVRDPQRAQKPNRNDQDLWDRVDGKVFTAMLDRFRGLMSKATQGTDRVAQEAFAVVTGDLVTNTLGPQRIVYRNALLQKFLPELDRLSAIPHPGVQTAVARALGNIVLELREDLRELNAQTAYKAIVGSISRIQKSPAASSRRAAIETAGAIIRPLNPDAGEETLNPKGDPPYRIDLLRVLDLAPMLFESFKDNDAEARKRAVNTFHRLAALMVKDFNILIRTPGIPAPASDRELLKAERDNLVANQQALNKELNDDLRPRLEELRREPELFNKVIGDSDPEVRRMAIRSLEDLAILQGFIRDRIIALPKKDEPMSKDPSPASYLEPLFEKTSPAVMRALKDSDEKVRIAAAQVLESRRELARPQAAVLVGGLNDSSAFVRWTCARAVGRLSETPAAGAVDGLLKLLADADLSVRIAAAVALETFGKKAATAQMRLQEAVHSGDADFREVALHALAAVAKDGKAIVRDLAKELAHPAPKVRRAAALALTQFGAAAAQVKDALKSAIEDDDPDVRRFAAEALLASEGK